MYYQQYNTIESASSAVEPTVHKPLHIWRIPTVFPYDVTHMTYNTVSCTLYIMYGYTLIIHDITLLLTTTHNS
jgi:hypothetical protein